MPARGITTLNEIMGAKGSEAKASGLDFGDLEKLLGEGMPKLEFHALGRVRLIRALKNRFGANYRSVPGINDLMSKFDQAAQTELKYHQMKMKWGRK